jgi:hypothetical protein
VSELSDFLKRSGIPTRNTVDAIAPILFRFDISALGDFCLEVSARLPRIAQPRPSLFSFIGNASFAGYPTPCSAPLCRIESVDSVARFAALYADHVLLPDPFAAMHSQIEADSGRDSQDVDAWYLHVATHLASLNILQPLLEVG